MKPTRRGRLRGDRCARPRVGPVGESHRRPRAGRSAYATTRSSSTAASDRVLQEARSIEFVDALPRRGFAVDYDALDAMFGGGGYPGGTTRSV